MEAQLCSGGGEVRRVHIVYFLSRNGHIEHPHLIRILHLSRNGVHLRDVKSWLSKLRGKGMPDSFAWSYKRKYKGGYVWQDLLDEDLITPICDNEYVLQGSEISSRTLNKDIKSYGGKEVLEVQKSSPYEGNTEDPKYPPRAKGYSLELSTNASTEIEESSFVSIVPTEYTTKNQDEYKSEQVAKTTKDKNVNYTNDNNNNNNNKKSGEKSLTCWFQAPPSPTYDSFRKTGRLSNMFLNWITCGTPNTHDKAVVVINKRKGSRVSTTSSVSENNMGQICEEHKLMGYDKSSDGKSGSKKSKQEDPSNVKTFGGAYKPVNAPNCSQCGKQFNPEKLHSHMKYCRGMKALAKSTNSRPKTSTTEPLQTFLRDK